MKKNWLSGIAICAVLIAYNFPVAATEPLYKWNLDKWDGNQSSTGKSIIRMIGKKEVCNLTDGIHGQAVHVGGDYESRRKNGGLTALVKPEIFTGPFTLELWVKFDDNVGYQNSRQIAGNGGDCGPGFRLAYWYNRYWVITGDGKKMISAESSRNLVVPKGQWLHLALTYQGTDVVLYMNAKEVLRRKMTLTLGSPALTIGCFRNGFAYPLNGAVDEIAIYNTALKEDEIFTLFERGNIR